MPSSPNYKRDYQQEKRTDRARGGVKKRAKRNAARRKLMRSGVVKKGDGKDVHHKRGIGGGNSRSNLSVSTKKSNRSKGGKAGNRKGKAAGARKANRTKRGK